MSARAKLALSVTAICVAIALASFLVSREPATSPDVQSQSIGPRAADGVREGSELTAVLAEPTRAIVAESHEAADSAAGESSTSRATLTIRVVARETGAPLADMRVRLFRNEKEELAANCAGRGTLSGDGLATDGDGFADCFVPAVERLTVRTGEEPWVHGPGRVETETAPADGRTEIVVEVPTVWTVSFFGRVRTEEGTSVADARVVVRSGVTRFADGRLAPSKAQLLETRSEPDGLFELHLPDWDAYTACVDAAGFSLALVRIETGHESPATATEVILRRSATLLVRALDAHGGRAGIEVVVETRGKNLELASSRTHSSMATFHWKATTDASGEASLEGLPSRAVLTVRMEEGDRRLHAMNGTLVLEPGERRVLEFPAYSGRTLRGRIVEGGRAVPAQKVWRLTRRDERVRPLASFDRPEVEVESDAEGRFVFDEVPPGTWWISLPAPRGDDSRAPLSLPVEVVVVPDVDPPEIVVTVERGAAIRGKVLDPSGVPAAQIMVVASRRDPVQMIFAHTDAGGLFEIGPLTAGIFDLGAIDSREAYAPSERLDVAAGAEDVVLRLRAAASLSGRVVDATTSAPCDAEVDLVTTFAGGYGVRPVQAHEGRFEDSGMLPGTYAACARTSDGRFGYVAGIVLAAGAGPEVEILVRPGARLALATNSVDPVSFEAWHEGSCVACGAITSLRPENLVLPAGPISVRTRLGGVASEHALVLAAGASSVLEIGK